MSSRARTWLWTAWAGVVLTVLTLHVIWPQRGIDGDYRAWPLGLMAFPGAAALILIRRPGNGVGRTLAVAATASLLIFGTHWYAVSYLDSPFSAAAELLSTAATVPQFGGMVALLYLFPTGRPLNRRHGRVFGMFLATLGVALLVAILAPGTMSLTGRRNPLALLPGWTERIWQDLFGVVAVFGLVGIWSLVVRWRHASLVERAQLRWFLAAAAVALGGFAFLDTVPGPEFAGVFVTVAAFWSLPAAIVVAVTRYRLYEIDRLVSRTIAYAVVASLLATVFAVIAVGLPRWVGVPEEDPVLVAAATLAAAALFNPVRRRVKTAVDRRFNRARYDAQREVERLAGRLRDRLGLDELTGDLTSVVAKTLQPSCASIWIGSDP